MSKRMMLGNEAVAYGARDGGMCIVSSYPGTPSTEITETAAMLEGVYAEWAVNEKVAAEVALGAAVCGARAMCCMKHVGLNVAADVLFTAVYTGVNSGLVFVVADDPGMHSSQNEQDTRNYARAAHVPMLEPSDAQEAYDYMRQAFALSEQWDLPVIVRMTTRVAHARGFVQTREAVDAPLKEYEKNPSKYVMMPGYARPKKHDLSARLDAARAYAESGGLNTIENGSREIGFVCGGISYQMVKEAAPDASILKLGMAYPFPAGLISRFARGVKTLYVVEEQEAVYERGIRAMGIDCVGAERFAKCGEISAQDVRRVVADETEPPVVPADDLPARPPVLCPGCPHRGAFTVINKMKLHAFGDIGCYTLGASAPLSALDTTICMGASIGMSHGAFLARGSDMARKSIAVIGDSTFFHSGMTGLASAAYNGGRSTVLILDNLTTGMTGHQNHPGTGMTLMQSTVRPLSIEAVCYALGAASVQIVDPLNLDGLQSALKTALEQDALSVVIARRPCVLIERGKTRGRMQVDPQVCRNCGQCLQTGCPALNQGEGAVRIDAGLCTGCGLCASVCPFEAIEGAET